LEAAIGGRRQVREQWDIAPWEVLTRVIASGKMFFQYVEAARKKHPLEVLKENDLRRYRSAVGS
jgi:hypothetical protein